MLGWDLPPLVSPRALVAKDWDLVIVPIPPQSAPYWSPMATLPMARKVSQGACAQLQLPGWHLDSAMAEKIDSVAALTGSKVFFFFKD